MAPKSRTQPPRPRSSSIRLLITCLDSQDTATLPTPESQQWLFRDLLYVWNPNGTEREQEASSRWFRFDNRRVAQVNRRGDLEVRDEPPPGGVDDTPSFTNTLESPLELYDIYASLPDDPTELTDALYSMVGKDDRARRIGLVGATPDVSNAVGQKQWAKDHAALLLADHLLATGAPTHEIQAKLYRALAGVPGLQNLGTTVDATGNEVITIGWDQDFTEGPGWTFPHRRELLIDASDYTYRGIRHFDDSLIFDDKLSAAIIVRSAGIVDEPGKVP